MFGLDTTVILASAFGLLNLLLLSWVLATTFRKCGPNQAMIISGAFTKQHDLPYKIKVGGGAVIFPLIQQLNVLSLEAMTLEVKSQAPIITKNGVPVYVKGAAVVKVPGDRASIATAAENFLGKSPDKVTGIAEQILLSQLRSIIATTSLAELTENFNSVAQRVQGASLADLAKIGLTIVSFTISDVKETVGKVQIA